MPPKSSRRLAGCIAIELLAAAALTAAGPEYRAGTATAGGVTALALEDRRGNLAALAQSDGAVGQALADFIAARLIEEHRFPREALIVAGRGRPAQPAQPEDFITAIAAALSRLAPARLSFAAGTLSVTAGSRCLASLGPDGLLSTACSGGAALRGPIRAAFQVIDLTHGLERRQDPLRTYPVQAIALGRQATILALGGAVPMERFRGEAQIVVPFANDSAEYPEDARVTAAIRQVLGRVRR